MTTPTEGEKQLQAFRDTLTSKTILIPAHFDKKTGKYIILWRDIQSGFKNVESVMLGNELIPPLVDENFELKDYIAVLQQPEVISVSIKNGMDIDSQSPVLITENHCSSQQSNQLANRSPGGVNIPGRLVQDITAIQDTIQQNNLIQGDMYQTIQGMLQDLQVDRNHQITLQHNVRALQHNVRALQHNVQALLRQTFELDEYNTPRLFVILPKPKRKRDKILKPFKKQFSHLSKSRGHPYKIHLAKHEGYDVENVDKLFEKYGSHIVNIMKILKIGLTVSGIAVPGMSHFVQGMESVAQTLGPASRNIGSLLQDSIRSVKNQVKGDNTLIEMTTTVPKMDFSQLRALEGADLRQLGSFLRNHDPGNVFGNLSRIADSDGHVRWVCNDHYHEEYREAAIQQFKAILDANEGCYYNEYLYDSDEYIIRIQHKTQAKEIYEQMMKTPGIQDLCIRIVWKVTKADMKELAVAITKAGARSVTLKGSAIQSNGFDSLRPKKMYNPIVRLMCNGHIEDMDIDMKDFYQHITPIPLMMTSRLRRLTIQSTFSPTQEGHRSVLDLILKHSPHLSTLVTTTDDLCGTFDFLKDWVLDFPNLDYTRWQDPDHTFELILSQDMQNRELDTKICIIHNDLSPDAERFIQRGHSTIVTITVSDPAHVSLMEDILRNNPRIWSVDVRVDQNTFWDVLNSVIDSRKDASVKGFSPTNWAVLIVSLEAIGSSGAMILKIESLRFCPHSLTFDALECMSRVIERSQNFEELHVEFGDLHNRIELEKAKYLLSRYNTTVQSLEMMNGFSNDAISEIASLCPTRHELPDLTLLKLDASSDRILSSNSVQWIVRMVSAPHPLNTSPHAPISILDPNEPLTECAVEYAWHSLREVWFYGFVLQHEDWRSIIMALDFYDLIELSFANSNFSLTEFRLLVDCIPEVSNPARQLNIHMDGTDFKSCLTESEEVAAMERKAPHVSVLLSPIDE
ncbi:hypothetical protein BGX31_006522 [Mortierella sp. GBA43]|nr:hypothetical protein BGX31_006522 [Mortierella sp. GBA43]